LPRDKEKRTIQLIGNPTSHSTEKVVRGMKKKLNQCRMVVDESPRINFEPSWLHDD
jgi:hypothetical protein